MDELDELIEKYYRGETSVKEENRIKEYLKNSISEEFAAEKAFFDLTENEQSSGISAEFESSLFSELEDESNPFRKRIWLLSGIAASLLLMVSLVLYFQDQDASPAMRSTKEIKLNDGSLVTLNANSHMSVADDFGEENRTVTLTGEAFFEVIEDPEKPFRIVSGPSVTTVLGTSFNLRNYDSEDDVELTVVTGKVSFANDQGAEMMLTKDESATLNKSTGKVKQATRSSGNTLSWKTRSLNFRDAPMSEVLEDVERHFGVRLKNENSDILNCYFTGNFNNVDLKEILTNFEYTLGITHEKVGENYVLSGKGCSPM